MAKKEKDQEQVQEQEQGQGQKQFQLDNGELASRAGYIRQEFQKDRSRKEIAEELGVKYNIVFSATANMYNSHHPEGGSGGGGGQKMAEDPRDGETKARRQIMRELYEQEGWTRGEIAAHFQCPYGSVYNATKDIELPEGARNRGASRVVIEHPETGQQIARVDFIKEKAEEGWSKREIADAAGCDYNVVWSTLKQEEEKTTKQEDKGDVEDMEPEDN